MAQADLTITCNPPYGAVVTAPNGTVYYLGTSCDAARKGGGTGHWWYAAGAFIVEINGQSVRYPRDIECDVPYCLPPNLRN